MIKLLTAYTREADDHAAAVKEIQEQLNLETSRSAHSAALIFCHAAFIESGVMEAVCKSLPVASLGCSCQYFALPGAADEILLTIAVLTSDDVAFAAGVSGPLEPETFDARIQALYQETAAGLGGEPSLIFSLQPTILNLGGNVIAAAIDHACGGKPVFGTAALDMDIKIRRPKTIFQGQAYGDRVALLLLKGPVEPRFFSLPFPGKSFFAQEAVITGVAGNLITSINNMPAVFFMQEMGLAQKKQSTLAFPLIIDNRDGTEPVAAAMRGITAEGALITSRHLQVGGILNIGFITAEDVLESAKTLIQEIKKNGKTGAGIIIFSCFLRNIVLGGNFTAEIELIQKELADFPAPYLFFYSGGEFCPQYTEFGGTVNRFYQYALVACQF